MAVAVLNDGDSEDRRGSAGQRTPARSRARLRDLDDVAVELARVYRMADRGVIGMRDATQRAYILHTLGRVIEAGLIEKRLTALEEFADGITTRSA